MRALFLTMCLASYVPRSDQTPAARRQVARDNPRTGRKEVVQQASACHSAQRVSTMRDHFSS
jgi:hypothetical protein